MTMTTIKTKGNQLFNVPNDEMGRLFLRLCSEYLNQQAFRTHRRGRAKNRRRIYDKTKNFRALRDVVPLKFADWIAFYAYQK